MIQLQNISFQYAGADVPVFKQFSLSLQPGRIYGLLGPNGSGKSTLLYIVMGLLHVQEGRVEVDGRDASRRERRLLQNLYIVPEEFELPAMTLKEYVDTYRPFYPHFSPEVLSQCLKEFDLPASLHTSRLSMGQKKKVLMAFALACGTRYLLMDEPTNGLDIASKKQFRKVIAMNMTDERTIVIATHQVHDVEQLLDHVLVLGIRDNISEALCDATVSQLTQQYAFTLASAPVEEALYTERTAQGYACITPRHPADEETPLSLELLYNAAQSAAIKLASSDQLDPSDQSDLSDPSDLSDLSDQPDTFSPTNANK
ncbi:MAG: ABC transporter ATP-binding protein [Prevotella sp.]|nr:ABC transporter ATP-binding protein [Prevotella sp.]MBQ6194944.1 ABC transporter ATP-binding protein [Prevotella sp.]